jgi:hypothetical protein
VTDATDTTVRIELEAIMKTVTVKKSDLALNPAQMAAAGLAPAMRPGACPHIGLRVGVSVRLRVLVAAEGDRFPSREGASVREWTWWAHTGGGHALAFTQPTWPYDIEWSWWAHTGGGNGRKIL